MPGDAKQLFISYSRVDVVYARSLTETLTGLGFTLWRDRNDMEGGENWWQQIEEAIRGVDTMILLLSQAALDSKVVSKEWRYARQVGTRVIPVIADSFPASNAPRWMSKRDWYDFRRRDQDPDQQLLWEKMLAQLRTPYQRKRAPFMAEGLPADYVARTAQLKQVIPCFVDENREEPRAVTVALKGAGGYGKTTLARAICADERIQAAFDDGILWVTFGEKVDNLTGKVDDLLYSLTGKHSNANTLEMVTAELSDALEERDILLVLDDVWNAADLKPFLQGGSRCARLITTRDAGTLPPNAQKIAVDEMAKSEAVKLLHYMLPDGEKAAFERLAERLGYWPLLLKLVNGALRDAVLDFHQSLVEALADMNQGLDEGGLTIFDVENTTDRSKAVRTTIELSLSRLSSEEKKRFEQLIIFPEDIDIPLETVGRLWSISGIFTRKLCGRLFNMSLLLEYNLETGTLRLHDVVRDYLKQPLPKPELHGKLLDSYHLDNWSELPENDFYMWEYLPFHLLQAYRKLELFKTVTDINYLAKKSVLLNPFKAENDLIWLEKQSEGEDAEMPNRELRQQFTRVTHILTRCKTPPDAVAVLWNRLILHEYSPAQFRKQWEKALSVPMLRAERPLPDLPPRALFRTLDGHRDSVRGIAFSPDGKLLVSVGDDRTVRLWSVQSGQSEREPLKVDSEGRGVAWSTDGTLIAVALRNGEVVVVDPESWSESIRWKAHDHQVRAIAIRPNSQQIISASRDGTLKVWDRQGTLLHILEGHTDSVEAVACNADGTLIASCDQAGGILVWDAESGTEQYRLTFPDIRGYSLAFRPDGKLIAIGCNAGNIVIWDYQKNTHYILHEQSGYIRGIAFSPTSGLMASGSSDQSVVLWSMGDWRAIDVWNDHMGMVRAVAWGPDNTYVATSASDRSIKLWLWVTNMVRPKQEESNLLALHGTFYSIAYNSDGRLIALEKSGRVLAFDPTGANQPEAFTGFHNDSKEIACSPNGNWILGLDGSESIKRWDARTGKRSGFLVAEPGTALHSASYSPDEQTLVVTTASDTVQIRSARNLALIRSWTAPGKIVTDYAAYSPDGQSIAVAGENGTIWFWLPATGEVKTITGHLSAVNSVAYSPNGLYIASVSSDRSLKVWDAVTLNCLHTFYADGGLYSVTWHPDNKHIVAGGARGIYWLEWVV